MALFCTTRAHTGACMHACMQTSFLFTHLHIMHTHSLRKRMPMKGKNRTLIKLNQLQLNDGIQIKCLADPCQLIENVFESHLDVYFLTNGKQTHARTHTRIYIRNGNS